MTEAKKPDKPTGKKGDDKTCGDATEPCPLANKKYEIVKVEVKVDAADAKVWMNVPEQKQLVTAIVTYKKSTAADALDALPDKVVFTHKDPGGNNTDKAASHNYTGSKFLGKKNDATSDYWLAHADHSASSSDSFHGNAKVTAKELEADKTLVAKVYIKPSGVGGNDYTVTAKVFKADGTTELATDDSAAFTVWRSIKLKGYQMVGQNTIQTHGSTASQAAYFTADTFVKYTLGTVTRLPAANSVKYIGLWDTGTSAMLNWATHSAKTNAEKSDADETTKANGPAGADQVTARRSVQAKADAWRDRIITAYRAGLNKWATDASVPANALVAIEYEHPKYSNAAPNADSVTSEWSAFPWLRISVEGRNIHPDKRWIRGQGLSYNNRAYITAGMTAARTKVVVAHEAGHETKNQFKRKTFGGGDHTSTAGLMDSTGSRAAFIAAEKKILRGFG